MGKVVVTDNMKKFIKKNEAVMDNALGRMAKDITQVAKIRVPFKEGDLFKKIEPKKEGPLEHRVVVDSKYAAYQERGRRADGTHKIRKYTTAGSGKGYLRKAAEKIVEQSLNYLKQAAQQARV